MKLQSLFESSFTGKFSIYLIYNDVIANETAFKKISNEKQDKWDRLGVEVKFSISKMSSEPSILITSKFAEPIQTVLSDLKNGKIIPNSIQSANINYNCDEITEREFHLLPQVVDGDCHITGTSLKSLHDLSKYLKVVNGYLNVDGPIRESVLSILKIKGLQGITFNIRDRIIADKLENIIKRFIPEGDIFDCQEALFDAGLEEYAAL